MRDFRENPLADNFLKSKLKDKGDWREGGGGGWRERGAGRATAPKPLQERQEVCPSIGLSGPGRETVAKWKLLGPPQWLSGQSASTLKGGLRLGTGLPGSPRKPSPSSNSILSGLQPR